MKASSLLLAALALAAPLRALELSLKDEQTQRGTVGYVDMQRIFAESPDAAAAKESFTAIVRAAEERVNLKKVALLRLQRELDEVKAERARLSKQAAVAVSSAAAPQGQPPASSMQSLAPGTTSLARLALAAPGPAGIPSASPLAPPAAAASAQVPVVSKSTTAAPSPPIAAISRSTAAAAVVASTATAVSAPAATPGGAAVRVLDLDARIIQLQAEILKKEDDLAHDRSETDRGLVRIEGSKADKVLVRIYRAISVVAKEERLSIVIDRGSILYGHEGVDLTDKVLEYLRSSAP